MESTALNIAVTGAVVAGVDGSTGSDDAARWAALHAALENRRLVLVQAVPERVTTYWPTSAAVDVLALRTALHEDAKMGLKALKERLEDEHEGLDVETYDVFGDPRDVLVDVSRHASLTVVGSRGRGSMRRALMGSTSVTLSRHAHGPILVVRPDSKLPAHRGVVVGLDADERSEAAVEFAFDLASFHRAPLTVVHSTWDAVAFASDQGYVPPAPPSDEETELMVSEATAGLREKYPDVEVHVRAAYGLPENELLKLSEGADLLVVGTRGRGTLAELLVGSTTTAVVEHAKCAVAVVPGTASA
ncbi:MAG TPA: universal stress protein [Nocardioides sp.]|nr:universal stress protein [Nocardioides sp.]